MSITQTSLKSKNYQALGIDEIADDITNIITVVNALEYTETIVNISSAEISAMGYFPVELLPAPGVNTYYDFDKIILEYTHGTVWYALDDPYLYILSGTTEFHIPSIFIKQSKNGITDNQAIVAKETTIGYIDSIENITYNQIVTLNGELTITTWNGTDPALGNGTLRVKIYHKTITFGA